MNISSVIDSKKYPLRGVSSAANSVWEDFWNTIPTYPATLPDPTKLSYAVGSNDGGAHIMADRNLSGYNDTAAQTIQGILSLNYNFQSIKGLSAKALFSYYQKYSTNKRFSKPVQFYTYDYDTQKYTLAGALGSQANLGVQDDKNRTMNGQLSLNYARKFGNHNINFLSLYELNDYYYNFLYGYRQGFITSSIEELYGGSVNGMVADGSTDISARGSFVNRLSYDFKNTYFLDITLRADGSSKFPKHSRYGYFPSIAAAWRISEEKFIKTPAIDDIKLRLSYGMAGNDNIGNNMYMNGFKIANDPSVGTTYLFGDNSYPGVVSLGLANPTLTWEKIKTYNAGIDFSFLKRKIYGEANIFYRLREGILSSRINNYPSTFGATLPPENLNSMDNRGFEFLLGTSGKKTDWSWDISGNISWMRAKWIHFEEPNYTDPDEIRLKKKSGEWVDRTFGYLSNKLFTSQADIDNLGFNQDGNPTKPNSSLRPGDVRYVDLNKDGKLDWRDMTELGGTIPHWLVGFNLSLKYKNLDLSALLQGAFGYKTDLNLRTGSVYSTVYYGERWTPENNNPNAIVPRLGGAGIQQSDFRMKDAGYLRLKSFAFGYTLPKIEGIEQIRFYIAGTNLLTFNKLKKYDIDPEAPSARSALYYPQQKTISLGLNATF